MLEFAAGLVEPPLRGVDRSSGYVGEGSRWGLFEIIALRHAEGHLQELACPGQPARLDRDQG